MNTIKPVVALSFAINDLPSLAPVLNKLSAVIANQDSSVNDMVKILKLDPALTGKILRLANSAYVGIPNTISSLKNAVVLLGQKRVHSLALTTSILAAFKARKKLPFVLEHFWRHSISTGLVAESISRYLRRYASIDCDEVFTAGLLHDIGKLVLGCYQEEFLVSAEKESHKDKVPFYMSENPESSHMSAGGLLAEHWKFPADLTDALVYHHAPDTCDNNKILVAIVHVSDIIVHMMGYTTFPGEIPPKFDNNAMAAIKLQPEHLRVIATESVQNEKAIESFINFFV
jgi:uncharacterized domain HDIG